MEIMPEENNDHKKKNIRHELLTLSLTQSFINLNLIHLLTDDVNHLKFAEVRNGRLL